MYIKFCFWFLIWIRIRIHTLCIRERMQRVFIGWIAPFLVCQLSACSFGYVMIFPLWLLQISKVKWIHLSSAAPLSTTILLSSFLPPSCVINDLIGELFGYPNGCSFFFCLLSFLGCCLFWCKLGWGFASRVFNQNPVKSSSEREIWHPIRFNLTNKQTNKQ